MDKQLSNILNQLQQNADTGLPFVLADRIRRLHGTMLELKKTYAEKGNPIAYQLAVAATSPDSKLKGVQVAIVPDSLDLQVEQDIDAKRLVVIGMVTDDDQGVIAIFNDFDPATPEDGVRFTLYMEDLAGVHLTEHERVADLAYGVIRRDTKELTADVLAFLLKPVMLE